MGETGETAEGRFLQDQLLEHAHMAFETLAPLYLGDRSLSLWRTVQFRVVPPEEEKGSYVPTVKYSSKDHKLIMNVEPNSMVEFAEDIASWAGDEASSADIVRLLVGAGVARCILAWKTLPINFLGDQETKRDYQELLCQGEPLWTAAAKFDEENDTNIQMAVERLGDQRMPKVNVLRFMIGASLTHLTNVLDWQTMLPEYMRHELLSQERSRQAELRIASAILEVESAFELYDDAVPDVLLAFSFPMSPAEELNSFATHEPDQL